MASKGTVPPSTIGTATPFPHFLANPDETAHRTWFGRRLEQIRNGRPYEDLAQAADTTADRLMEIERGDLALPLGSLYDIVQRGYGESLPVILGQLFEAHRKKFDPEDERPFERDHYYSYVREEKHERKVTPVLIGGDGTRFVWATPLRQLKSSPMVTEFLELARHTADPNRLGKIPMHAHGGAEIIFVVHGTVSIVVKTVEKNSTKGGKKTRRETITLSSGSCIHFVAEQEHFIANAHPNTPALLHVTRVLKL